MYCANRIIIFGQTEAKNGQSKSNGLLMLENGGQRDTVLGASRENKKLKYVRRYTFHMHECYHIIDSLTRKVVQIKL